MRSAPRYLFDCGGPDSRVQLPYCGDTGNRSQLPRSAVVLTAYQMRARLVLGRWGLIQALESPSTSPNSQWLRKRSYFEKVTRPLSL